MLGNYQILGTVSNESLLETFLDSVTTSNCIRKYRTFLEDAIEQNYNVGCNLGIKEHGPLTFDIVGEAKLTISMEALHVFERACRIDFVRCNATSTATIR